MRNALVALDKALARLPVFLDQKMPNWLRERLAQRAALVLNHLLYDVDEARARLARQQGRSVVLVWQGIHWAWKITSVGLVEPFHSAFASDAGVGGSATAPDLKVLLLEDSPWAMLQKRLSGKPPAVRIEGDVQLAAEVSWLFENVRWDFEEDLSRFVGDPLAHTLVNAFRRLARGLRDGVARYPGAPETVSTPVPASI